MHFFWVGFLFIDEVGMSNPDRGCVTSTGQAVQSVDRRATGRYIGSCPLMLAVHSLRV